MLSRHATCGTNRRQGWTIGGLALALTLITGGLSSCSEMRSGSLPSSSSSGPTTPSSVEPNYASGLPSAGAPETASVSQAPTAARASATRSAYPRFWADCGDVALEPNSDSMITHLRTYSSHKNGCSGATTLAMEVAKRGSFLDPPNTFTMFSGLVRCSKIVDNTALAKADYRCEDLESITTWTRT